MQKKVEVFLKLVLVATFFVPLIMAPRSFIFPFIVPKIVVFRSLILLLLGGYLVLLAMHWERYRLRFTPPTIAVLLFTFSFALSTFIGLDWYRSFWDNHERMLGLFTVLHYVLYYLIATSVIRKWRDWRWLLRAFLLAGGLVMLIALIQRINPEFFLNSSGSRTAATLGNPIYVGGYGLFLTAVGWLLTVREDRLAWKAFAAVVGLMGIMGVFFSGSRGAVLGLLIGFTTLFVCYIITLKENKRVRWVLGGLMLLGVATLAILYPFRKNVVVANLPAIGRLLNTSLSATGTRPMAWAIALEGWKERPILGWGPSNYYFAFNKFYRAEFLRYGYAETWFDNAHNIILNTLTERGLVGVITYLGLFVVAITTLWRAYKRHGLHPHTVSVGTAFLLAHLAQTVSVFENPTSYLYFFFFLAFLNSQIHGVKEETEKTKPRQQLPVGTAALVTLCVLVLILTTNINPARANMATLAVIRDVTRLRDPKPAYERALSIPTPHIDDVRNDFGRAVNSNLRRYVEKQQSPLAQALFELAYRELDKNRQLHPLDIRVHAQQALMAQEVATLSGNKAWLVQAEEVTEDALSKSPKRQQLEYTLAGIKVQLGKLEEAEKIYKQSIANDPQISEAWWRLALLYDVTGKKDEAKTVVAKAREMNLTFTDEGESIISRILPEPQATGTGRQSGRP